ncbi:MAG: hypothetical protein ACKVRN_02270 [Pyrinomonadaceae bacterium]
MPGSLPNPVVYFPVKIVVYAFAGWALNRFYGSAINPLLFGILRVIIGFGVGFILLAAMSDGRGGSDIPWLTVTRLLVWTGMIWAFYERKDPSPKRFFLAVLLCTVLSFGIDGIYSLIDKEFPGMFSIGMC